MGSHPRFTRAIAHSKGALPRPATQCIAIRGYLEVFICCSLCLADFRTWSVALVDEEVVDLSVLLLVID